MQRYRKAEKAKVSRKGITVGNVIPNVMLDVQPTRRFAGELTKARQTSQKGFND